MTTRAPHAPGTDSSRDQKETSRPARGAKIELAAVAGILVLASLIMGQAGAPNRATQPAVQTKASQAAMTPAAALEILKQGNRRFVAGKPQARNLPANVRATAAGQYPFAAILSCMDSRVPVEQVFDLTVGDVFSLRVAGNVVNADILGSLEYATKVVGVKHVLVLGHTHCGAVKGAIDGVKLGNLTELLAKISPAITAAGPAGSSKDYAYVDKVALQNVRLSMKQIRDQSPTVRELLDSGAVALTGGMYDLETGAVTFAAK